METLARAANRGSISTGYDIENSYKNESDNTERMYRAWGGITANTKTWTVSLWVKRTELGSLQYIWGAGTGGADFLGVGFLADDTLRFRQYVSADHCVYVTNRVFRDTSAWYHIVAAVDTTNGTAGDRLRIYINGVEETSFSTETNYSADRVTNHNANGGYMEVGAMIGSARFNGYIAEVNSITGTQYAPTAFGEFDAASGIWIPIQFAGSYAENSVFLEFKDSSSLGTDTSGNGQTFTLQNLSAADQSTDTPTNNFVIFNPLNPTYASSVISEGATKLKGSGQNTFDNIQTTIGVTKGKWYCELEPEADTAAQNTAWGVVNLDTAVYAGDHYAVAGFWSTGFDDGRLAWHFYNGSGAGTETVNYGTGAGDTAGTIAMALDLDNGTLKFYIRNTQLSISASSLPAGTYAFYGDVMGTNAPYLRFNFGGYTTNTISSAATDANGYGTFEYAPPSGYYALCTKNLAEFG